MAQSPPFILWLLGSWNHTDPPRILPFSSPDPLSERDVSHWSQFLRVLILSSRSISLFGSRLMKASCPLHLSSYMSPQIHVSESPTLQKTVTFLLLESRYIFLHLRLNSWGPEWFDSYPAKSKWPDETRLPTLMPSCFLPLNHKDFLFLMLTARFLKWHGEFEVLLLLLNS